MKKNTVSGLESINFFIEPTVDKAVKDGGVGSRFSTPCLMENDLPPPLALSKEVGDDSVRACQMRWSCVFGQEEIRNQMMALPSWMD